MEAVDVSKLLDVGLLGVVFLLVVAGKFLRPTYYSDRLEQQLTTEAAELARLHEELAKRDAEVARLNAYIADRVIPVLVRFSDTAERRAHHYDDRAP